MPKIIPIEEKRKCHRIRVVTRLRGTAKEKFLDDLQRGAEKEHEIVRRAIVFYYENKDRPFIKTA